MSDNKEMACYVCAKCQGGMQVHNENNRNQCDDSVEYKCSKWLEENEIPKDDQSVLESEDTSLSISEITEDTQSEISDLSCQDRVIDLNGQIVDVLDKLTINKDTYRNIRLSKCKNVHMGPIAKLYGPVQINQTVHNVVQNAISNEIFLNGAARTVVAERLNILERRNWLAQPPVGEIDRLQGAVKFVIISHTATESAVTQAENIHLVRLIQTFHIESKKWNDIAYNFLVGCDGKVYEGRGWGAVGAHTYGYNKLGIGISFIGCFMNVLPNDAALYQAKALIDYGVEIGEIDENYVLVGHCQCCPTESPGKTLFDEIQTWDHWSNIISQ